MRQTCCTKDCEFCVDLRKSYANQLWKKGELRAGRCYCTKLPHPKRIRSGEFSRLPAWCPRKLDKPVLRIYTPSLISELLAKDFGHKFAVMEYNYDLDNVIEAPMSGYEFYHISLKESFRIKDYFESGFIPGTVLEFHDGVRSVFLHFTKHLFMPIKRFTF